MSGRTMLMFLLTVVAAIVWALGHFGVITVPPNLLDFVGGAAVGLTIGAVVAWAAERTPRD